MAGKVLPGMDWNRPIFHVLPPTILGWDEPRPIIYDKHVAPSTGWINDPDGPIYHKGKTHIFYQHVKDKPTWDWGIVWGHASSEDLVHWRSRPTALTPSARGADSAGCWSGCVTVDRTGQAHALYTGVRLKGSPYDGASTEDYAPTEPMIESVMCARCADSSHDMQDWGAGDTVVAEPPAELMADHGPLEGWRDPFVISTHQSGGRLRMIQGSGFTVDGAKNGCVLLYSADEAAGPWQYEGIIASGDGKHGRVWECPALVQIPPHATPDLFSTVKVSHPTLPRDCVSSTAAPGQTGQGLGLHMLLYGAYESVQQQPSWHWDPVMCQLGNFDGTAFHAHHEPVRLDIGDAPYAANVHIDGQGQVILWLWLRDPRAAPPLCPPSDTCGCLAIPRILSYSEPQSTHTHGQRDPVVFQQPVPELAHLRGAEMPLGLWSDQGNSKDSLQQLCTFDSSHFEAKLQFVRKDAALSGILLTVDSSKDNALLVLVLWEADEWMWVRGDREKLERMPIDVNTLLHGIETSMKGPLDRQLQASAGTEGDTEHVVGLRVFVDGSAVELFTSSGKAASTRLYGCSAGALHGVASGGVSSVSGALWPMKSCWKDV